MPREIKRGDFKAIPFCSVILKRGIEMNKASWVTRVLNELKIVGIVPIDTEPIKLHKLVREVINSDCCSLCFDGDEELSENFWLALHELEAEYIGDVIIDYSTMQTLEEFQEKYFDLVWFARRSPEDWNIKPYLEVEDKYPEEIEKLRIPGTDGDWQHGFHSGMLACLRLVSGCIADGVPSALEEFPMLDS